MIRKLLMVGAAVALPLGLVTTFGLSSAGASGPVITANGHVNCTTLGGKIAFNPPIMNNGTATSETSTIGIKLSNCTPTSTNLPAGSIITGKATGTVVTTGANANACTGLETSHAVKLTVKWKDKNSAGTTLASIIPTTGTYSGYDVLLPSNAGFDLPKDSGGTVTGTSGSFLGTDSGATSEANAFTVDTIGQLTTACGSSTGVAKLKLGGPGTATDPSHAFSG